MWSRRARPDRGDAPNVGAQFQQLDGAACARPRRSWSSQRLAAGRWSGVWTSPCSRLRPRSLHPRSAHASATAHAERAGGLRHHRQWTHHPRWRRRWRRGRRRRPSCAKPAPGDSCTRAGGSGDWVGRTDAIASGDGSPRSEALGRREAGGEEPCGDRGRARRRRGRDRVARVVPARGSRRLRRARRRLGPRLVTRAAGRWDPPAVGEVADLSISSEETYRRSRCGRSRDGTGERGVRSDGSGSGGDRGEPAQASPPNRNRSRARPSRPPSRPGKPRRPSLPPRLSTPALRPAMPSPRRLRASARARRCGRARPWRRRLDRGARAAIRRSLRRGRRVRRAHRTRSATLPVAAARHRTSVAPARASGRLGRSSSACAPACTRPRAGPSSHIVIDLGTRAVEGYLLDDRGRRAPRPPDSARAVNGAARRAVLGR